MKKFIFALAALVVLFFIINNVEAPENDKVLQYKDLIKIFAPLENDEVGSPLVVRGEARGNWYFEASFPVYIYDANGKELGVVPAQAQGEWMTKEYVPFETKIEFSPSSTATGTLVLQKDNASGLPEFDDEVRIPIRFRP